MFRIARMFLSLGTARLTETRDQISRKAIYVILMAIFGLMLLVFGLAAITVALADRFGLLEALGIMAGAAFLGLTVVMILMKIADRRHRVRAAEQAELQARLRQLAMLSAVAAAKPKLAHVVGLGVLGAMAAMFLTGRGGDKPDA